jgi:hypothetical protein
MIGVHEHFFEDLSALGKKEEKSTFNTISD